MRDSIHKYRLPFLFLLILCVGTFLRLLYLGKECLWLDEAISYYRGLMNPSSIIRASYGWDVHPPTYYLIVHFIIHFGKSEITLRLFSALCGILAIPTFYLLALRMLGKQGAFISALFLTLSVFQIRYSQEARVYSLFFLISLLSFLFFYAALTNQHKHNWLLWAGISVINFYVHYFSLLLLASEILFYFFYTYTQKSKKSFWHYHRWFITGFIIIILGSAPQIFFFIHQAAAKFGASALYPHGSNPLSFGLIFLKEMTNPIKLPNYFLEHGLKYLIGAFIVLGTIAGWRKYRNVILFNGGILLITLLFGWISSLFLYFAGGFRYLIFLAAPFLILLTLSIMSVAECIRATKISMVGMLIIFGIINLYILFYYYKTPKKPNWRAGTSHLIEYNHGNSTIIPIPEWADYVVRYYLSDYRHKPGVLRIKIASSVEMDSLSLQYQNLFFITDGHLPPSPFRNKIDRLLRKKAILIWQDPHFLRSAIWLVTNKTSIGDKKQKIKKS